MEVNHAFRVTEAPDKHGTWGNGTIEATLRLHPELKPLVEALKAETSWAEAPRRGGTTWSALIFEVTIAGKTQFFLEMKPPVNYIRVPVLEIDLENPPTIEAVKTHILGNFVGGER